MLLQGSRFTAAVLASLLASVCAQSMGDLCVHVSYVFHFVSHRDVDLIVGTQQGLGGADQDNVVQIPYISTSFSITSTMG